MQFTDPSNNTSFAYVGKRTTGTEAGDYLITGPGWKGAVPRGMAQISSPNNSVLVLGRVFVESDSDLSTAYALTKQIQVVAAITPRFGELIAGQQLRKIRVALTPLYLKVRSILETATGEATGRPGLA